MSNQHTAFVGSVPENYDKYMSPIFFDPYAADMVNRLPTPEPKSVLELACGTGILTRKLRDHLPANTRLIATDLNQSMIDFARRKFRADEAIEWQAADATKLPFADEMFDLVVCQFGMMFLPDKLAGMRKAYRVLVPGGTFLFSVWDAMEQNEISLIVHEIIKQFFPANPPLFYETPFGFHNEKIIEEMLKQAGFKEIEFSVVQLPGRSPSATAAATGLIEGTPLSGQLMERDAAAVPEIVKAVAAKISARYGEGAIECQNQALVWRAVR